MTEDHSTELVVRRDETAPVVLWGTDDPRAMTARMTQVADAMKDAIEARGMFTVINDRKYVLAEGWSLVGAMIGVFPRPRMVEELRDDEGKWFGFRATVDLVTRDGGVVGGAVALCTTDERAWADRDPNQIASMAQTRATAKAYRSTLGFIMPMAGYAATPAEEMDGIGGSEPQRGRQERAQTAVRNNRAPNVPSGPIVTVGALLTWALHEHGLSRNQVLEILHLDGDGLAALPVEDLEIAKADIQHALGTEGQA